jgi:hypothetical protein
MATITSTSQRITISGDYKDFTGGVGSTTTVIQFQSGDAPASGDAGRFLLWKVDAADTGTWQVRYIESATATAVTVGDGGFGSAPPRNAVLAISTSLDDIEGALADTIMRKAGRSYQMIDRDFELASGAFVADVDASLSTKSTQTGSGFIATYPVANGCVLQFGRLIGGEANDSVETIGGCQVLFEVSNNTLMLTDQGAYNAAGPVINWYGCLVESIGNGNGPFVRSPGPMRIIGCVMDGPMGGRLYSPASELVDTRFSGNLSGAVAWSLGGSFVRAIDNAFFYQNVAAIKSFQAFTGTFSNTRFADSNTHIIEASALSGLLFRFVDCTTFDVSKINGNTGNYEQLKSIKYTIADASGTGLTGVKVAVYDNAGTAQGGGVQTSSSGTVPQINARFFRKSHNVSTPSNFAPFDIRIRRYGYVYLGFSSTVADSIEQEVRLVVNGDIVSSEAQAAAITGISLDFSTETVTITGDTTTQDLYDYYQYQLDQTANMVYGEDLIRAGNSFDLDDWDMVVDGCDYEGDATTTGTITLINGATFTGTRTDQNGTVLPLRNVSIAGLVAGSRVRIYNQTTATEVVNQIVAGTSYSATYAEGTGYSTGDTVQVFVTQTIGATAKLPQVTAVIASAAGWSLLVSQEDDAVYNAFAVDGSSVTNFTADYANDQVDVVVGSNFNLTDFYAWWAYNLTTESGIREFFGGLTAVDEANFRINSSTLSMYLDNTTTANIRQLDNRRLFREDSAYPVLDPTSGGGGIDVVWKNTILISSANQTLLEQIKIAATSAASSRTSA